MDNHKQFFGIPSNKLIVANPISNFDNNLFNSALSYNYSSKPIKISYFGIFTDGVRSPNSFLELIKKNNEMEFSWYVNEDSEKIIKSCDISSNKHSFYSHVSIIKPHTSRIANSEKYVVCRDFKYTNTSHIFEKLHSIFVILNCMRINDLCIANLLDLPIPYRFINAIEEINASLGRQQIDNILITLRFIQNKERKGEKLQQIKNANIQKCIQWCIKNKIPHNKLGYSGNIFLSESSKKYKL